jgi:hypothetical protein
MGFFGGGSVPNMVGATSSIAGTAGLVPAPEAGNQNRYLQGDGLYGGPLFNNIEIPAARYIGPLIAYGGAGTTKQLISFYVLFVPVYSNKARSISEIKLQVTTASGATGAPTIEVALYNTDTNGFPTTRITNSLTTGIDAQTAGVKTLTYSPSFTIPPGISMAGIKVKASASNNNTFVRSMDGSGRENSFLASVAFGWPNNPTTTNYNCAVPYVSVGDSVGLASDYTGSSFSHSLFGENFVAIFLKT